MTDPTSQSTADKMRSKIEDAATDASRTLGREAKDVAENVKDRAEDETRRVASAADAAAGEFKSGSLQEQAAQHVATSLEQVAVMIRDADLRQTARQVSQFARENPLVFLGGAALVGFAAARFMKSSGRRNVARSLDDPWSGHVTSTPLGRDLNQNRLNQDRSPI